MRKSFKVFRDGIELGKVIFCYDAQDAIQVARQMWGIWERDTNGDYGAIQYTVKEIK